MINRYELYKGNKLVAIGTIKEIANKLGIEERTVRHYSTPSYSKRAKGDNSYRLYKKEFTPIYKYNRFGNKYTGTLEEIQEQTGLTMKSLRTYASTGRLIYIGEC